MTKANRSLDGERARLALEQALLLVQYLEVDESPDYRFVRTHALTLLQLVDGFDGEGLPIEN